MPIAPVLGVELEPTAAMLRSLPVERVLLPVLWQLALIVVVARVFFVVFRKLGQPGVVGEIAAGLVLGPSVLGAISPGLFQAIFHPEFAGVSPEALDATVRWIFTGLAQVGLIFLLFLIGLEFDFSHLRRHGRSAAAISAVGVAAPFLLGVGLAALLHGLLEDHPDATGPVNLLGLALFLGTALSITAIPTLGRMMIELGIQRTRLGAVTITAAAVDDATGWILLAAVASLVRGNFELSVTARMFGLTMLFALAMVLAVRPLAARWAQAAMRRGGGELTMIDLAALLVFILTCSIVTNLIGVFAIFGAFLAGAILSGEPQFREAISHRLRDFVVVFFLPIFFTYTGLRTDVTALGSLGLWLLCAAVFLAALVGKFGGCGLAAWWSGFTPRESACIGVMMNTRALMELIVINVGYELRVIPPSLYCMLVLMAFGTTVMTTPILMRLARGTELEQPIDESGFRKRSWNVFS